jgi:outer membrane protein OmpA-like peptidoglycan-associated protein
MHSILRFAAPLLAGALLAGCSRDLIVMLPRPSDEPPSIGADGKPHPTGIVVQTGDGKTVVLEKPYASDRPGDSKAGMAAADDVTKDFGEAIAAQPIRPKPHKLTFVFGKEDLTPDTGDKVKEVIADIKERQKANEAVEIVITGHTDPSGTDAINDDLSSKRAMKIRDMLKTSEQRAELEGMSISISGRGSRDAHVPPGVDCEKNHDAPECQRERYVEITVQ